MKNCSDLIHVVLLSVEQNQFSVQLRLILKLF